MSRRIFRLFSIAAFLWMCAVSQLQAQTEGLTLEQIRAQTPAEKQFEMHFTHIGALPVGYWMPAETKEKQPLLLFSHGFYSCGNQSSYLMEALAKRGYWVFATNHQDVGCGTQDRIRPEEPFSRPEDWTDKTYADRGEDVHMLLDNIQHSGAFKDVIDFSRVGLIGHSLGGYTMLGLAGAWPSWKPVPNVKAVLALAPYIEPYIAHKTLGGIQVPVMYQTGTRDADIGDAITEEGGGYDQTAKPKYLIELDRATHMAWTDASISHRAQINEYAIAFFDHYIKGLPATAALTTKAKNVERLMYDSEIGTKKE